MQDQTEVTCFVITADKKQIPKINDELSFAKSNPERNSSQFLETQLIERLKGKKDLPLGHFTFCIIVTLHVLHEADNCSARG